MSEAATVLSNHPLAGCVGVVERERFGALVSTLMLREWVLSMFPAMSVEWKGRVWRPVLVLVV